MCKTGGHPHLTLCAHPYKNHPGARDLQPAELKDSNVATWTIYKKHEVLQ